MFLKQSMIACMLLTLSVLFSQGVFAAEKRKEPDFTKVKEVIPGKRMTLELSRSRSMLQREISPGGIGYGYSYAGPFVDETGENYDLYSKKPLACAEKIRASGNVWVHSVGGGNCNTKSCYSSKVMFVKKYSCRK